MATFPALTPSTRLVTPATHQFQPYRTMSAVYDSTLLCGQPRNQQISLSFLGLSTADKDSIVTHYEGQQSSFLPFDVPNSILSGFTAGDYLTGGYLWRYLDSPEITDRTSDQNAGCVSVHDVSLTLISEVAPLQFAAGADLRIGFTLTPGVAIPISPAPGADLTLTLSLSAGAATADSEAAGANLSVTLSLDPGAATAS
jgi:hypothetical protein